MVEVAEYLGSMSIDQIATYDTLSEIVGSDVRGHDRYIVLQALEIVNRESGIAFANQRGIGYRRLASESGVKHAGETGMKRVRRAACNGKRRLENALRPANNISHDEQVRANQRLCALGLIEHLAKPGTVKTLPEKHEEPNGLAGLKAALGKG